MVSLKTILVATDFSEPSEVAVRYGRALADAFGSTLHVLHVVPDAMALPWAAMADGLAMADVQRQWEREAHERLHALVPDAEHAGMRLQVVTRAGDPVRQITSTAPRRRSTSSCWAPTAAGRWLTCSWVAWPSASCARRPARC
jgi:nucleotide-binding universal stress UspA family protein